jgi:hypothetical protein
MQQLYSASRGNHSSWRTLGLWQFNFINHDPSRQALDAQLKAFESGRITQAPKPHANLPVIPNTASLSNKSSTLIYLNLSILSFKNLFQNPDKK